VVNYRPGGIWGVDLSYRGSGGLSGVLVKGGYLPKYPEITGGYLTKYYLYANLYYYLKGGKMREIKFRAWDGKRMGNVVEMDFAGNAPNHKIVFARSFDTEMLFPHDIVGVLMQYTGLKDKNGKEIYEGDIVRYYYYVDYGQTGELKECLSPEVVKWSDMWTGFTPIKHWSSYGEQLRTCEVIGNIYENPEILKV